MTHAITGKYKPCRKGTGAEEAGSGQIGMCRGFMWKNPLPWLLSPDLFPPQRDCRDKRRSESCAFAHSRQASHSTFRAVSAQAAAVIPAMGKRGIGWVSAPSSPGPTELSRGTGEKTKCLCRAQELSVLCHVEQERIKRADKSERHEGEEVLVIGTGLLLLLPSLLTGSSLGSFRGSFSLGPGT